MADSAGRAFPEPPGLAFEPSEAVRRPSLKNPPSKPAIRGATHLQALCIYFAPQPDDHAKTRRKLAFKFRKSPMHGLGTVVEPGSPMLRWARGFRGTSG